MTSVASFTPVAKHLLAILVLACVGLAGHSLVCEAAGYGAVDYMITIDAGSKGSRAHIYKWEHRHSPDSTAPFSMPLTKEKYAWQA